MVEPSFGVCINVDFGLLGRAGTCFDPEQQYCTPCLEGMVCDVGCAMANMGGAAGFLQTSVGGFMGQCEPPDSTAEHFK